MKRGTIMNTIHPYVGITRIRYEGIISARTSEHPLIKSAAKLYKKPRTAKRFGEYLPFTFLLFTFLPLSDTHTSLNNVNNIVTKFFTLVDEIHIDGTNGVSILVVVDIVDIL